MRKQQASIVLWFQHKQASCLLYFEQMVPPPELALRIVRLSLQCYCHKGESSFITADTLEQALGGDEVKQNALLKELCISKEDFFTQKELLEFGLVWTVIKSSQMKGFIISLFHVDEGNTADEITQSNLIPVPLHACNVELDAILWSH